MQWQLMSILDFYPHPPRGGRLLAQQTSQHLTKISIHALREEGDPGGCADQLHQIDFYPRPPRGGRRRKPGLGDKWFKISIHALREEGDILWEHFKRFMGEFLSTPSARRATYPTRPHIPAGTHFYPRPPRGGRPGSVSVSGETIEISIHALREEGDAADTSDMSAYVYFYPRPPRGGRRLPVGA